MDTDKELWMHGSLRRIAYGSLPVDAAMKSVCHSAVVPFHLLPMPAPAGGKGRGRKAGCRMHWGIPAKLQWAKGEKACLNCNLQHECKLKASSDFSAPCKCSRVYQVQQVTPFDEVRQLVTRPKGASCGAQWHGWRFLLFAALRSACVPPWGAIEAWIATVLSVRQYARLQLDVAVDSQRRVAEDLRRHPSLFYAHFVFFAGQLMGSGLDPKDGSAM